MSVLGCVSVCVMNCVLCWRVCWDVCGCVGVFVCVCVVGCVCAWCLGVCDVLCLCIVCVCVSVKIYLNFSRNTKPAFILCELLTLFRELGPVLKNIDTSVTTTPALAFPDSFVSFDDVKTALTPEDTGTAEVRSIVAVPLTSGVSGGPSRGAAMFSLPEVLVLGAPETKHIK